MAIKKNHPNNEVLNRLLHRVSVGLLLAAVTVGAHAQLQLTCPVRWEQLVKLQGPDVDSLFYGVKIRDWRPEFFDAMALKHDECMAKANWPESVRKAERADVQNTFSRRDGYFRALNEAVAKSDAAARASQLVQVAREQGLEISQGSTGNPLEIQLRLRFPRPGSASFSSWDCYKTGGELPGWLDDESIKKLSYYTSVCVESGRATQQAAANQREELETMSRLFVEVPSFAALVSAAARAASPNPSTVAELSLKYGQIVETARRVATRYDDHPLLKQAGVDLKTLSDRVGRKSCDLAYARGKFPDARKTAWYLADINMPEPFPDFICLLMSKGAQVRYLPGGWLSKEGFEIQSSTRTVQVFTEDQRIPGGDPKAPLIVPVAAKIDGKKVTITRQNYRAVQAELFAAMLNQ
ncbi:hypothetical protein [Rhodoferax sp.]|uniref:hypothetical protein n=1 Tax=Rhodoferax sp. TaxID=50421 RepID=UPI0027555B14|nr:hypothetical protein [Rhodoferax sp.]